jgi:HYDIN/CFA65/VesB family protein
LSLEVIVNRGVLSCGGLVCLAVASFLGCGIDDRNPTTQGEGSLSPGGAAGQGAGGSGSEAALTVTPSYVELGPVTRGFAARARLRVSNSGSTPVPAPLVFWAPGGDADLTLIQDQCTGDLAPGEQCDLRVQVVPSRVGQLKGTLDISGASAGNLSVPVTASGLEPGPLVIQPAAGSFQDFGGVHVGVGVENTFTVVNPGAVPSGFVSFSFNRPEFVLAPAGAGECSPGITELASGESCSVRVAFTPTERGALESTLSVTSAGAGSRSLTLRGQGLVPAVVGVSASLLDFGGVVPGDTASLNLEVENRGDDALTLASAQLSPADVFRIADGNCGEGVVLKGGERCSIQLDYRPVQEGQPSAAELLLAAQEGAPNARVELQGVALTRGNLVVEALEVGQENFGDVLLGQSVARGFRVSNPAQQPSGVLRLTARNGFEIQPPSEAGACEAGVTELANGQSCSVQVSFAPSARGARAGAVTVDSPLAGAKALALSGRGISPGVLEADTGTAEAVIDFGRITAGGRGSRTLELRNAGDQPLPPPELRLTGDPLQASAFSYESGCTQALAPGAECSVLIAFAPEAAVPHAASLELVAPGRKPLGVLLLGEALEAGRLVLAPVEGASPDYGDVPVGGSVSQSFSVTNPGGGVSGALSLRADDSQFVVPAGACAEAGADGLADGESCAFEVSFTPTTNVAAQARLSVQAAGSGETGIALTGRGRLPAALAATTTERDLGRANIGEPSGPTNQFTWTVNNGGDLTSGALSVSNDNLADFDITADTCSTGPVAGAGSCALTIVFAPDSAGDVTTRIVVTDALSGQAVPLTVTGFGVQLAAPGESCLATTDCMAGVCTAGVCCDQECGLTCQSCATGQCLAQSGQQPCGNSGGVCFGVEQCALPAGGGCTDSTQCGGNLVCKQCLAGGSQCTPPEACCGGCGPGYTCVNGACGCAPGANGLAQLDCGGGDCALDRQNACCPDFPPAGCNCDPSDNLCKQCLQNGDCTSGPAGGVATCTAQRSCNYSCPANFKLCQGSNSCIPNAQCCETCGAGQDCQGGQCRIGNGRACSFGGTPCASGNCAAGLCCQPGCNNGCFADGTCGCAQGTAFARGQCLPSSGAECDTDADCAGSCVTFFVDFDDDSFGNPDRPIGYCGSPPLNPPLPVSPNDDDCCDTSDVIKPSQTTAQRPNGINCPGWTIGDANCDGNVRYIDNLQESSGGWLGGSCEDSSSPDQAADISCNQRRGITPIEAAGAFGPVFDASGNANFCGNMGTSFRQCQLVGGVCSGGSDLAPPCL